ncbi:hypothetical protein Poli38472_003578 [Pythium oligandrum]|uniref:C-CAP/cofactor C-like domain-containing protein n=1 Tax=Pythium oligandrum TaxID=41045 RepID=A0A8K1CP34_PYTOL|nr:hypothetical protein Poli38472_003578 [Pythium oligandrum]|eukprot:TMW65813.1 hypothetical protein Poli38472_003578 [Pythium oligandrum]
MPVFVASDGTKFEDRNAWRRYEFETNYTFRNRTNETLIKTPGKISGQPFDLSDLENCEVQLLDQIDQVQVDNVNNSRLFIGPSSESVFVRNCSNCIITVACKQLRTRDCTNCTIYLYSLTDPIIETSSDIKFAPFNGAYCGLEQHFKDARLEPTNNHWSQVYDFNDPDKSGHNWRLLKPDEECAPWVVDVTPHVPDVASLGPCVNPVPRGAGYIQYEESNSTTMKSFSIATTQMQAQQALEAQASVTVCHAPPPALAMAPPPPQPVEAMAPPLPPPAPLQPPAMENQKVAVVEAPELLAPPPCPSGGCCSNLPKAAEPAVDAAVEKTTEALTHLTTSS